MKKSFRQIPALCCLITALLVGCGAEPATSNVLSEASTSVTEEIIDLAHLPAYSGDPYGGGCPFSGKMRIPREYVRILERTATNPAASPRKWSCRTVKLK